MTSATTRVVRTAAASLLVLLAAGCGSSSTATPAANGDTGAATSAPTTGSTTAPTTAPATPEQSSTPSSDVVGSTDLTAWLTQVCTASNETVGAGASAVDPGQISKDPQKAAQNLVKTYQDLGNRLTSFADRLEQIGAPDLPNGKDLTDRFVDDARVVGNAFTEATQGLPANPTLEQVLAKIGPIFKSGKVKAAMADWEKAGKSLDMKQIEDAAKGIPACKKADIG